MKFIIELFTNLLKLIEVQSTSKENKDSAAREDEEIKNAYKWFIDKLKDTKQKELSNSNEPYLQPGKIYVFKYEPDPNQHPYYDKHPIVLALGKMKAKEGMMNV